MHILEHLFLVGEFPERAHLLSGLTLEQVAMLQTVRRTRPTRSCGTLWRTRRVGFNGRNITHGPLTRVSHPKCSVAKAEPANMALQRTRNST